MEQSQSDLKFSVLKQEWDHCENAIARYDTIVFGIRGWAVTVFSAMLAASISLRHPQLILLAICPTVLFWIVEAVNKSFQELFIERVQEIETYLRSTVFENGVAESLTPFTAPRISQNFVDVGDRNIVKRFLRVFRCGIIGNVLIPYLAIVAASILCWIGFRIFPHL
ncbi:MAG: hypothetical protein JO170_27560 [Verrucomicrobia bacterium]|nr:hypothetical protein [Verrucomicrobiota bacterium]